MAKRIPWIERTFDFDFPVERYPEIVERMRGTPARVEDRVRGLPPALLTRRPEKGWSIQENVGHLLTVERLWYKRLDDFEAGAETLRAADMSNRPTLEADHNASTIESITAAFRESRLGFVARLDALDDDGFATTALHPRLQQPMRVVDMCFFIAEHDDYHLARITELRRMFGVE
ncbi:MAG: DinB family protein [Phycisphaerales bacterium]|nr:MAG: DinB family protein [Phycisphaerales bacterium]